MTRNLCFRTSTLALRRSSVIFLLPFLVLLLILAGCKGKSKSPSNIGGGYILLVSGGTLNDGSGVNGLAVLVTLRDSGGNGPGGAAGWQIKITGPGINSPLVVSYDDGSQYSYSTWWWEEFDPLSGTYTATATNGTTTLTYNFSINAAQNLTQPDLNKSGSTIWWNPVTGAGSYYYEVTDGSGGLVTFDYIASDPLLTLYSFELPGLTEGSYLVSVYALTKDRLALASPTSPSLPSQENDSLAIIDFVHGGTGSGYALDARGGVLYEGLDSLGTGTDAYGLVIWTSLVTNSTPSTPPAGDWDITVTGPGITKPIAFTYPRTNYHYVYWDFGTVPVGGETYTVSAIVSGGTTSLTQSFTIPSPASKLPVAANLSTNPTSGGGASISWDPVPGANSYYVNIWTDIWNAALNRWVYTEIAGNWMKTTSAVIPGGTLTKGISYDVYVTACELDMTDTTAVPPPDPGSQTDMSDTTFTYATITAQ